MRLRGTAARYFVAQTSSLLSVSKNFQAFARPCRLEVCATKYPPVSLQIGTARGYALHARARTALLAVVFLLAVVLLASAPAPAFPASAPDPASSLYDTVTVSTAKTSIYVGSVTLALTPFKRVGGGIYTGGYKATVIPFFIFNESGELRITFTAEQLERLERGERVGFSGDGKNKSGSPRPVTGHATADAPGAKTGKIKVRVFVTKKTALVFDTTYAFESPPEKPAPDAASTK